MRVAIFDPGLVGRQGHHFDQDLRLARAIAAKGHPAILYGHRELAPEVTAEFAASGIVVQPHFRLGPYAMPKKDADEPSFVRRSAAVIAEDIARAAPADIGFWPSANPAHFVALASQAKATRIIVGLDGHLDWFTQYGLEAMAESARTNPGHVSELLLAVFAPELEAVYRQILGDRPIRRIAVPIDGAVSPRSRTALRRVGLFGHQRGERGTALLTPLILGLLDAGYEVVINDSSGALTPGRARERLTVLGFVPDLSAELTEVDLVVWPSDPSKYLHRPSGIVWQSIACGVPVVVPSRCLPARIAVQRGAAVFYHRPGVDSILSAVRQAAADYPSLSVRASEAAQAWAEVEGVERLATFITEAADHPATS